MADYASNDERPNQSRNRNLLHNAINMVGNGGLGNPNYSNGQGSTYISNGGINDALERYDKQFIASGPRSLAGIAIRAFSLGISLAISSTLASYLAYQERPIWRAPFFVALLSLFHFLEFWITAHSNTSDASVSSFLLTSNGSAYTIAHSVALLECTLTHLLHPAPFLPTSAHYACLVLGLIFVGMGQVVRTMAMNTAGQSFSHLVAHQKRDTHTLITHGLYAYLRHPAYFGFFWWGIGTQLVCGNALSLVGFSIVLWYFFHKRIIGEEESLVKFFGKEYVEYKGRTSVGIPFIR